MIEIGPNLMAAIQVIAGAIVAVVFFWALSRS